MAGSEFDGSPESGGTAVGTDAEGNSFPEKRLALTSPYLDREVGWAGGDEADAPAAKADPPLTAVAGVAKDSAARLSAIRGTGIAVSDCNAWLGVGGRPPCVEAGSVAYGPA